VAALTQLGLGAAPDGLGMPHLRPLLALPVGVSCEGMTAVRCWSMWPPCSPVLSPWTIS